MSADVQTIRISEDVRLVKRNRSTKWQARVKLATREWHRFSTKTENVDKATDIPLKFHYASEDRLANNLSQNTRKFKRVAEFARDRLLSALVAGVVSLCIAITFKRLISI